MSSCRLAVNLAMAPANRDCRPRIQGCNNIAVGTASGFWSDGDCAAKAMSNLLRALIHQWRRRRFPPPTSPSVISFQLRSGPPSFGVAVPGASFHWGRQPDRCSRQQTSSLTDVHRRLLTTRAIRPNLGGHTQTVNHVSQHRRCHLPPMTSFRPWDLNLPPSPEGNLPDDDICSSLRPLSKVRHSEGIGGLETATTDVHHYL